MRPIVTQDSVSRLPRLTLLALCVLYGVPGFFGHDPWRDAEALTLAQVLSGNFAFADLASWLALAAIKLFSPLMGAANAARLPFLLLLWGSFAFLWYATFHFALNETAQPTPLPFGGEAGTVDYARAVADGSLLVFMACLGLAEKGHQGTALVGQLFSLCMLLYALAAFLNEPPKAYAAVFGSALLLCGFGAAGFATVLFMVLALVNFSFVSTRKRLAAALTLSCVIASAALLLPRSSSPTPGISIPSGVQLRDWFELAVWFLWPLWFAVLFGIWRIYQHRLHSGSGLQGEFQSKAFVSLLRDWHLSIPLLVFVLAALRSLLGGNQDASLFIALPALAIVAALMLALLPRNVLAAIDWFALALFTGAALFVWVLWIAAQTGAPAAISNNIDRFYPGYREAGAWPFEPVMFVLALLATAGWLALVVWRTSRARKPLWKGMVLTAGGITLTWMLLQTLGAPMLNASRSYAGLSASVERSVPASACVTPVNLTELHRFLFSYQRKTLYALSAEQPCGYALVRHARAQDPARLVDQDATLLWSIRRPTERDETFSLFKRSTP